MAIGGRSTSARTFLEKHFEKFSDMDEQGLIQHAVEAMNKTTGTDSTLTVDNTSVVIISKTAKFRELSKDDLQKYLSKLEPSTEEPEADEPMPAAPEAPPAEAAGDVAPMDTSGS
mmetsp:Transcript_6658/g.9151  ORF Transcript_6658/g.9151 Transcript_6658/m.9151 type:complete len:115 (-) Transcript_6658:36-380(-)